MGAFEDRLAEGYRQAANTPAKMPQPTTPTGKHLARMHDPSLPHNEQPDNIRAIEQEAAAQIAERVEAEWYNGNISEAMRDRILGDAVPRAEAAAAERRRLLEIHMADHDDATGWCPTCALLTEDADDAAELAASREFYSATPSTAFVSLTEDER